MDITFRKAGLEDLDSLQEISIETFKDTFEKDNSEENMNAYLDKACTKEQLEKELKTPGSAFFYLDVKGELAGYLKVNEGEAQTEAFDDNGLEIERIYIRTGYKRQGLGTALLNKAIAIAEKNVRSSVWLGVWEHNQPALAFYKKMGFEKVGAHAFYMGDDKQTDFIMRKKLARL
ncbi:GNAT family N-acetyltransferase [Alkalibacterium olivapovliticus]|uniref:Ribosomal protein S18 acetylase RimI-like enzyme n=1 Tax=Alkalibacterium olivapovliticus TaxID=99907 RepID=A0A2T0VUE2_9LACT|nr:N-acetyltransferase [Alkalibacterium olivapovliticus]PRY74858.1 ribosomal protein S18 acetylase RimI-like enzyme [Alkalibacterium olivapovliticus]